MLSTATDSFPKLNASNYNAWSIRIRSLLTVKGLDICLENENYYLKDVESKTHDNQAKAFLFLSVDDKNLSLIEECSSAYEIWNKLSTAHTKMDGYHALLTLKDYVNGQKRDDEKIDDYIYNKLQTYKKLTQYGLKLDDKIQIGVILIGLPTDYEAIVRTINLNDKNIKLESVKIKLLDEERIIERKQNSKDSNSVNVLAAKNEKYFGPNLNKDRSFSTTKYKNNERDSVTGQQNKKYSNQDTRSNLIKCFRCNKYGTHLGRDCPEYGDHLRTKNSRNFNSNPRNKKYDGEGVNVCIRDVVGNVTSQNVLVRNDEWLLDSGCTDHMTNKADKLNNLTRRNTNVVCANGDVLKCEGIGEINLRCYSDNYNYNMVLTNVLYVPKLRGNLLSVAKLCEKSMTVNFNNNEAYIVNEKGDTIVTAKRRNEVYILTEDKTYTNYVNGKNNDFQVWHSRMGHPGRKETEKLLKEYGISAKYDDCVCEICSICNIKRLKYPEKTTSRRSDLLELVHSDIIGPISPTSRGGNKYILTFTDDYSRYSQVYMIKNKFETFQKFKEFQLIVERRHGKKIKTFRSDNGGEYVNNQFKNYFKENGIEHELTSPGCPAQNGVAERLNQTLMNIARCLLQESGADADLWAEAILTACYIKNRRPTTANDGLTPYERWNGRKARVDHMKKFGCRCWYLNRNFKRKQDPRGRPGIFVGYEPSSKAYRIWDEENKKIVISRDVKFAENVFPMKEKKHRNDSLTDVQWTKTIDLIRYLNDSDNDDETVQRENKSDDCFDRIEEINNEELEEGNLNITESTNGQDEQIDTEGENNDQNITRTRSGRVVKLPVKYKDYEMGFIATKSDNKETDEPRNFKEACQGNERDDWMEAIDEEFTNLTNNDTWTVIERPKNCRTIRTHWIFRKKKNEKGEVVRYKARLVALGNKQISNIDYDKTYSPVVMRKTMRILLAISARKNWDIQHIDINAAYLNAKLPEDIYLEVPEGYENNSLDRKKYVCKLNKSLYGLHQSGMLWNEELNTFLLSTGLVRSMADPCVYYSQNRNLIVSIFVDDIALHGEKKEIDKMKQLFKKRFSIKDLGQVKKLLSININKTNNGYRIDQSDFTKNLIKKYNMENAKGALTPLETGLKLLKNNAAPNDTLRLNYQQLIGSLLYLATNTRPDITYAVTYLSQFNSNPTETHWKSAKRILRYLKRTEDYGITYERSTDEDLHIYSDSDWGGDLTDRKSYSGYVINIAGGAVSWMSRKQRCVALSTAEAEFTALCECSKEVKWLRSLLEEFRFLQTYIIQMDNTAAMKIAENYSTSDRSKHIDLKMLKIRDDLRNQQFQLKYVETSRNLADIFTKATTTDKQQFFSTAMGIGSYGIT